MPKTSRKAKPLPQHIDIPTIDDIRECIKVCDRLEKALMLVGVTSGLASNEILNLKVGISNAGTIRLLKLQL